MASATSSPPPAKDTLLTRLARGNWPLIGRQEELAVISEALVASDSAGVVIAGAPGVGRSRLLHESVALAERQGFATTTIVGLAATSAIPLAAFSGYPLAMRTEDESEMLQRAATEVVRLAEGKRLALVVDDAHLLDDHSAALVHRLARSGGAFVIVGVSNEKPSPAALTGLWKDGLAQRLELQSLSRGEVEELLAEVLGGYVDVQTSQELWRESQGNPLFLRELVLSGVESGTLRRDGDIWRRHGPATGGTRLAEVVRDRFGHLQDEERALLELLAVTGKLEVSALDRLASPDAVAALEAKGLLAVESDRRRVYASLTHPVYAEVLRPQLQLRGRAVRGTVADVLEGLGLRRQNDLLRVATLRLDSTSPVDPGLAIEAARQAESLFDHTLAQRLAEAAVHAGGGFAARLVLAEAISGLRQGEEAERLLAELHAEASTDEQRARVSLARATNLMFNVRDAATADGLLRATEAVVTDPDWRDELALMRGAIGQYDGRFNDVLEAVLPVVHRAGVADDRLVRALTSAAHAYRTLGKASETDALADRALTMAKQLAQPLRLSEAWLILGKWRTLVGHDLVAAEALAVEAYERAIEERYHEVAVLLSMPVGASALFQGKVRTAQRRLSEALSLIRRHDLVGQQEGSLVALIEATAVCGDMGSAESAYAEAAQLDSFKTYSPWLIHARAWLVACRGELAQAQALCRQAIASAREQNQRSAELVLLHSLVRLAAVSEDVVTRLNELSSDGPLFECFAAHARAVLAGDGEALEDVVDGFERIGANLWAAEAAADAVAFYRRDGKAAKARRAAARAEVLLARCEGARTPALAPLEADGGQRLTERQRYIATLAAKGLASKEIASQLNLSVRTVDNQLARVYTVLGVSGRSELAELLGPSR